MVHIIFSVAWDPLLYVAARWLGSDHFGSSTMERHFEDHPPTPALHCSSTGVRLTGGDSSSLSTQCTREFAVGTPAE